MRITLSSILLVLTFFSSSAQYNLHYNQLDFGRYNVGFHDTVLFQDSLQYSQFNFKGKTPLLVKVWHPVSSAIKGKKLTVKDFQNDNELEGKLANFQDQLNQSFNAYYRSYHLSEDYTHFDEIDYSPATDETVLNSILKTSSRSMELPIAENNDFPVVIYHHGSRGVSYDNYIMAEYLASHGYIVVAGNFNFPYEGKVFGYSENKPFDTHLVKQIIDYSTTLSTSKSIGFIGHSWGAQIGFSYLPKDKRVKSFVSLETTLELWDSYQLSRKWKNLSTLIKTNKGNYNFPVLMFANQGENSPVSFEFFKSLEVESAIFASAKKEFMHDSYANLYSMRLHHNKLYPQLDAEEFKDQIIIYSAHLKFIRLFLNNSLLNIPVDYDTQKQEFFLKIVEPKPNSPSSMSTNVNSPN